jgi:hypothetical protein
LKEHFGNSGDNGNNGNLVKIMYRSAQTYIGKGEYEMAKMEVEKIMSLDGGSEEIKN